jgi:large subunit ribosomal protein L32e
MAEESPPPKESPVEPKEKPAAESAGPAPTPKKSQSRPRGKGATKVLSSGKKGAAPKAPNRPTLDPETKRLLLERRIRDGQRPKFVRQQAHRYYVLGRPDTWRRPRGQQSKQRRHYGYRSVVVSIGFGSPRGTRGLTPSGFRPVVVHTPRDLEALDVARDAAIIARTVGTRKRLVLEEAARRRGVHVLNPLLRERGES